MHQILMLTENDGIERVKEKQFQMQEQIFDKVHDCDCAVLQSTMPGMKRDCGGAAAVLGAFYAAVKQVRPAVIATTSIV